MISAIIKTSLTSLRRDRGALALSFVLPIVFFTIFAVIFGGRHDTTPRITVLVVDEDHSTASQRLAKGLDNEGSLHVLLRPAPKKGVEQPEYTATTAEAAVRAGDAPVAIVIPHGFGLSPIAFGGDRDRAAIQLLKDSSDMVASQVIAGLLQKVAMTAMPDVMAEQGTQMIERYSGGLTPEQRKRMDEAVTFLRHEQTGNGTQNNADAVAGGIIAVKTRDVVGENKNNPMVSFYAAAIGVMFLLFTSSGAAGALLDEAESGTLDRVLSSRVTMTSLLAGKVCYNALLAFVQLVVMFLWGWAVRHHGCFDCVCGRSFWDAARQRMQDESAIGCAFDTRHSDHVIDRREYVSAVPHAGSHAKGRTADHQCMGDRRLHESFLA